MNGQFIICPATLSDFETAVKWAQAEGWNPGLDDLEAFHRADPSGFLMGWLNDEPVSSISVVKYGSDFGFLGFYIVHPDHRGTGIGVATWQAGLDYLDGRSIALDGVPDQQDNYQKSGFEIVGRNMRFTGMPIVDKTRHNPAHIRPIGEADIPALLELDHRCFGMDRAAFITQWCMPSQPLKRLCLVALKDEKVAGFGVIRPCASGYKIGPLFTESSTVAGTLFNALVSKADAGSQISIDVPQLNTNAVRIAKSAGLEPVFETARMVRGSAPKIDWECVFAISTLELG